jgi:hypothetical protein
VLRTGALFVRREVWAAALAAAASIYAVSAAAQTSGTGATAASLSVPTKLTYEAAAGADGAGHSWSVYGGLTAAFFGDLREDGLRLRAGGGYGRYRYARPYFDSAQRRFVWPEFFGQQTSADLLIGYQFSFGPTTLKPYLGFTEENHRIVAGPDSPIAIDDENGVQGGKRGLKVVLETWTRLSDWGFLQADVNWSQPFESYGGRARLGYFLGSGWSTGVEAAAFGNLNHDGGRAGAFLRYEWSRGEVSLSAGADGDHKHIGGGYASIGGLLRF